jgi:DNA-binding response OmpR family regulator
VLEILELVLKQEDRGPLITEISARNALKILTEETESYDCLIFDIAMPDIDGIELCRLVRAMPAYNTTPIVMLTAKDDSTSIERAFGAGANDFIAKPFDIREIASRIGVAAKMRDLDSNFDPEFFEDNRAQQASGHHPFEVSDPILLAHMQGLTDHFSLGNYLVQLERKKVASSLVFAVNIEQIGLLYNECISRDFSAILRNFVKVMVAILKDHQALGAYMGNGNFMFICDEGMQNLWPEMETLAKIEFEKRLIDSDVEISIDITLSIGRPSRPNSSRTKRVGPAFDKAIAAAQRRKNIKAKEAMASTRRFIF